MKSHESFSDKSTGDLGAERERQSFENNPWDDVAALSGEYDPDAARAAVESERANIEQSEASSDANSDANSSSEAGLKYHIKLPSRSEAPISAQGTSKSSENSPDSKPTRPPLSEKQRQAISSQARASTIKNQLDLVKFQSDALKAQLTEFRQNNGFLKRRFGKTADEFRTIRHNLKLLQEQRKELESELTGADDGQGELANFA